MNKYAIFQKLTKNIQDEKIVTRPRYAVNQETGEQTRIWYPGERHYQICPKLKLNYYPFQQWLYHSYSITDYKKLNTRMREKLWLEYRAEVSRLGFFAEGSEHFNHKRLKW